jgi:heme/copper-type cytochrome/quinol oxidase subunit 2
MPTQQPPVRKRGAYSPLWVLVPAVLAIVLFVVSVLMLQFGDAVDPTPVSAEPTGPVPLAIESHGD